MLQHTEPEPRVCGHKGICQSSQIQRSETDWGFIYDWKSQLEYKPKILNR